MLVRMIEVIEVTDYEVVTSDCGRAGETAPRKRYFLRDGTPLEVATPQTPTVSTVGVISTGGTCWVNPSDPNIYATVTKVN